MFRSGAAGGVAAGEAARLGDGGAGVDADATVDGAGLVSLGAAEAAGSGELAGG
jgi:hypothetical protein